MPIEGVLIEVVFEFTNPIVLLERLENNNTFELQVKSIWITSSIHCHIHYILSISCCCEQ